MRASLLFVFLVSLSTAATLSSLGQTTITVTSNADTGTGSLREAIDSLAAPGDTIVFHENLSGDTIRFDSGQILINFNLTIDGSSLDEPVTLSGDSLINNDRGRIFTTQTATINLKSLVFEFGEAPDGDDGIGDSGGAIRNAAALTIEDCIFRNNTAGQGDAGFLGGQGGAIYSSSPLVVRRCVFHNNSAGNGGQNFSGTGGNGGAGGAIMSVDTLVIEDSTFYENAAGNGATATGFNSGDGGDGGAIFCSGGLTVERSTLFENRAGSGGSGNTGGGDGGAGGGIMSRFQPATINNSTFYSNAAGETMNVPGSTGGGGGGVRAISGLEMRNCTIVGNRSGESDAGADGTGGGLFSAGLILSNTVIAMNQAGDDEQGPDISVTEANLVSEGVNFIGDNSGSNSAFPAGEPNGDGNLVGDSGNPLDPLLSPLTDNGGFTATMLPTSASLLVDPIGGGTTTTLSTDQRGLSRFEGLTVDIGAVEFNSADLAEEEAAAAAAQAAIAAQQAARAAQQAAALRAFLHARYSKKIKKFKKKFKAAKRKGQIAKAKKLKRKFKKFKKKRRRL